MRVNVSGKQFIFPRSCACCGAYPLTHLTVTGTERNRRSRTKGWSWEVPYCVRCKRHIRQTERTFLLVLLLLATSVVGGIGAGLLRGSWSFAWETLVSVIMATILVGALLLWRIRNQSSANCRGLTRALLYLGSNGSCHSFEIRSRFYAADFVLANHRKLVNASPKVVAILRGTRFGDYQVPRRIFAKGK